MKQLGLAVATIIASFSVVAREAPMGMSDFNRTCPAPKVLPMLETSYQGCVARELHACDTFVTLFRQLLPEYDCQRAFDATPKAKYVVPAIWLAGEPALDRYLRLLSQLSNPSARELFASPEFRAILDGEFAETYLDKSRALEKQLKPK
jgi:hypothetical protein